MHSCDRFFYLISYDFRILRQLEKGRVNSETVTEKLLKRLCEEKREKGSGRAILYLKEMHYKSLWFITQDKTQRSLTKCYTKHCLKNLLKWNMCDSGENPNAKQDRQSQ